MSEPEFYIEPIVGWRTWSIIELTDRGDGTYGWFVQPDEPGHTPRLVTGGMTIWPARDRLVAQCRKVAAGKKHEHPVPSLRCSCGIYAARKLVYLREHGYAVGPLTVNRNAPEVTGEVSMWGRTMVDEGGEIVRSQFAYPKRLFLPWAMNKWARPLADAYGVPVEIRNPYTLKARR